MGLFDLLGGGEPGVKVGERAPEFALLDANGREVRQRHRLPFTLLADQGGKVRKLYGVPATLGLLPGRVTFVIDAEGLVRHAFNSQLAATRHVGEALDVLRGTAGHP